jgi:hypothetical protein
MEQIEFWDEGIRQNRIPPLPPRRDPGPGGFVPGRFPSPSRHPGAPGYGAGGDSILPATPRFTLQIGDRPTCQNKGRARNGPAFYRLIMNPLEREIRSRPRLEACATGAAATPPQAAGTSLVRQTSWMALKSFTPSAMGRWKVLRPEIRPMPPARLMAGIPG